jgi:hypothetical protein
LVVNVAGRTNWLVSVSGMFATTGRFAVETSRVVTGASVLNQCGIISCSLFMETFVVWDTFTLMLDADAATTPAVKARAA